MGSSMRLAATPFGSMSGLTTGEGKGGGRFGLAVSGPFCLVRSTTYDANGRVNRDADEMIC